MKQSTKYLKILCNMIAAILILVFVICILPRLISYFMPFVVGFLLALIANPVVKFLEKKIKIKRKYGTVIMIVGVIAVIVLICYGSISLLATGLRGFMDYLPTMYSNAGTELTEAGTQLQSILDKIPFIKGFDVDSLGNSLHNIVQEFLSGSGGSSVSAIGDVAKSIPDILVGVVVGLLATYFFIADNEKLLHLASSHVSDEFREKTTHVYRQLVQVVGGYFKAQFKIMGVIYVIIFIGLLILRVRYAWLIAFGIAFLDMLPVFGTGTVLCPWAVVKFFSGNYMIAIGMLILYVISLVVHQLVQPKLIGDSVGMDPFATLFFMYIGYRCAGVLGMIIAIPIGMILINLYKAGAFDTYTWCIKEVVHDFNSFRRIDKNR